MSSRRSALKCAVVGMSPASHVRGVVQLNLTNLSLCRRYEPPRPSTIWAPTCLGQIAITKVALLACCKHDFLIAIAAAKHDVAFYLFIGSHRRGFPGIAFGKHVRTRSSQRSHATGSCS